MPTKQFFVKLSAAECETLHSMLKGEEAKSREFICTRILFKAEEG